MYEFIYLLFILFQQEIFEQPDEIFLKEFIKIFEKDKFGEKAIESIKQECFKNHIEQKYQISPRKSGTN